MEAQVCCAKSKWVDQKPCVLVVDDEMFIRALLSRRLDRKGYRVLQCANTEQAYRTIKTEKPDAVVCDILMPGGDGVSFCRQLHVEVAATH